MGQKGVIATGQPLTPREVHLVWGFVNEISSPMHPDMDGRIQPYINAIFAWDCYYIMLFI